MLFGIFKSVFFSPVYIISAMYSSKRIINLSPVTEVEMRPPGTSRILCAHCQQTFLVS